MLFVLPSIVLGLHVNADLKVMPVCDMENSSCPLKET